MDKEIAKKFFIFFTLRFIFSYSMDFGLSLVFVIIIPVMSVGLLSLLLRILEKSVIG